MPEKEPSTDAAEVLLELRLRAEALERQLTEVQRQTEARIVHAELKAEAVRAGIVDPDGLKLLDTTNVKLNSNGEVDGAGGLIADLKKAKPWLFGVHSSSSTSAVPPAAPPTPKLATQMTEDEWRAARAALIKRRP